MDETEEDIPRKKPAKFSKRCNVITTVFLLHMFVFITKYMLSSVRSQVFTIRSKKRKVDPHAVCNSTKYGYYFRKKPGLYAWDINVYDKIADGYNWASVSTLIAGGVYADKFGTRKLGLITILATAVLILLCPLVIKHCKGIWQILMTWNIIFGMIQGTILTTCTNLLGQWILPEERTTIYAINTMALKLGYLISFFLGRFLTKMTHDWTTRFYVFGTFGLFCGLLWYCWCFSCPELHPKITEKELTFLRRKLGPYVPFKKKAIPLKKMVISVPVWGFIISNLGTEWAIYLTTWETTKFLRSNLKINLHAYTYILTILPVSIMSFINIVFAITWDYLIKNKKLEITTARKIYANLGGMGVGIFTLALSYTGCHRDVAIALFNVIMVFYAIYMTGVEVNILDLAANFAGTVGGIASTLSTITVLFMDEFVTDLVKDYHILQWRHAFWATLGVFTCTTLFFTLTCSGEERTWNVPPELRRKDISDDMILEEHHSDIE